MAASSSRRSVVKGIGLGAALATCTGLGALYRSRSLKKPATKQWFAIATGADARCPPLAAEARRRQLQIAAWLAFATLAPGAQHRLLTALETLADSIEARLHPLGFDLLDESPDAIAKREAPWLLPIWTAARTIARRCFVAGDSSLAVVVRDTAAPLPRELASFDPFYATAADPQLRLARFLCWPISAAARVRPKPEATAALRERCAAPGSALALVIDGSLQAVDTSLIQDDTRRRMQALRERLSRLARTKCHDCDSLADVIDALTAGLPEAPALDWLDLDPGEALAVPRLRAVSEREAFLRELGEFATQVHS